MKIEKLVIYGFGKHQDRKIEVGQELSIFYGTNEAGKTTIQQFIIQTLFGFPAKNQNLRRYEPKNGGKYGGQVHIKDPVYGQVIIERVKGKSAGDVTLYFEDGTRGAEAELKAILRDYDRASFEAVFSFSIHELQGLEAMTEEELSRTLLASGTTGMDAIGKLESRVEKEMGEVFKKNGRNPQINQAVEELRMLEGELKDHRSRLELYEPYLLRTREIETRLDEIQCEETAAEAEVRSIERWLQALPLIKKRNALEAEAALVTVGEIPPDGRRRMDRLVDRLSEVKSKIALLEKEQVPSIAESLPIADLRLLEQLLEDESLWHQLQAALQNKKEEAAKALNEQNRLLSLVGMESAAALEADVSLSNEERLLAHLEKVDLEEEENRFRSRKLAEEKVKLADTEKELKFFLAGEPSERERKAAEEWLEAAPKLAEAKAAGHFRQKQDPKKFSILLIALGVIGSAAGLVQSNYILAIIALLAAAAGLWQLASGRKQQTLFPEYEGVLAAYGGREAEFEALIAKLAQYDHRLDDLLESLESAKNRVSALSQQKEQANAKQAYQHFLDGLGLNPETGRKTVLELFSKLREIHLLHSNLARLYKEIHKHEAEEAAWLKRAETACGKPVSADGLFTAIRMELNTRKEKNQEMAKKREKAEVHQAEMDGLKALDLQINKEQQILLDEADTATIESFYLKCSQWEQLQELKKELAPVQAQLAAIGDLADVSTGAEEDAFNRRKAIQAILAELKQERHLLLAEQADKLQTTRNLLSSGEYEDKLQQFEEKKVELAELAKRWSVDKAIAEAIRLTMDELKEKKLPAVIEVAQDYFGTLTGNAYQALEMNPQGYFEAVREDGIRFHIAELSQATKEQAYLSLRLSLAVSMQDSHPFPIIMDDPFVHFDRRRLQHVINLITELQQHHQFIYFTCHDSMRQAWPKAAVIDVATIERSVHS